jgi:hypothetical protein
MPVLHNVVAEIRKDDVGIESTTTTTLSVIHPVEADDEAQACQLLEQHYQALSDTDSPYGTRYYVIESRAFALISAATLAAQAPL